MVHCIAKCDLQGLQRAIEGGADGCIPGVEPDCLDPVAASFVKICFKPFRREYDLDFIKDLATQLGGFRPGGSQLS